MQGESRNADAGHKTILTMHTEMQTSAAFH